jgi:hypothetical protein
MILQLDASDCLWDHEAELTIPEHIPLPNDSDHELYGLVEVTISSYCKEANLPPGHLVPVDTTITFNCKSRTRRVLVGLLGLETARHCFEMCCKGISGPIEISEEAGQRLIDLINDDIQLAPENNGCPEWMEGEDELQRDLIAAEIDDDAVE